VWLGRAGMVAQGVMYTLVGGLAIALALGLGGKTTDQRGALHTLADASVADELAERARVERKEAEVAAHRADEVDPDVDD
jgi:hypothetical protein